MEPKKPGRKSKVEETRLLIQMLKEEGVLKFAQGDTSIEFVPGLSGGRVPVTIDDDKEFVKDLEDSLQRATKKAEEDLFWST